MFASPGSYADPLLARADEAASAALRELPEALVVVFDDELRFVVTAGQALSRLGDKDVCKPGRPVRDAFPPDVLSSLEPLLRSALDGDTRTREIWTADERHCLMVDVGPLPIKQAAAENGFGASGGVAVVLDITARRRADVLAQAAERPASAGFEELFERAPIGTGLLDLEGRWVLVNRALCEITGYTVEELVGRRFDGIMHPDDVDHDAEQRGQLLAGEIPAFHVEKRYFDAAGETGSAIIAMSLIRDGDGAPLHYIAQLQDISERKRLEEHLRHLADHDPLTGVRNRRLFEHDLKLQAARCQRYGEVCGLMVIDLDAFKAVNDVYGHKVGDEVLQAVARGLARRLRQTDLIARLGGDEFAVMLPHIDAEGLAVVAEGLSRVIPACSVDTGEALVHPSASVGWTIMDRNVGSAEQALVEADRAMYAAKRSKPR